MTDDDARRLISKFESGETSVADEQALYAYFRTASLPDDLKPMKDLMAWYENGCEGEPEAAVKPVSIGKVGKLRMIINIAASVAVVAAIGMAAYLSGGTSEASDDFAEIYAGSYVIRDGVKITDPDLIREDILKAQSRTDSIMHVIERKADSERLLANAVEKVIGDNPRSIEIIMDKINNQ